MMQSSHEYIITCLRTIILSLLHYLSRAWSQDTEEKITIGKNLWINSSAAREEGYIVLSVEEEDDDCRLIIR